MVSVPISWDEVRFRGNDSVNEMQDEQHEVFVGNK